jgi:hypothetical protein
VRCYVATDRFHQCHIERTMPHRIVIVTDNYPDITVPSTTTCRPSGVKQIRALRGSAFTSDIALPSPPELERR